MTTLTPSLRAESPVSEDVSQQRISRVLAVGALVLIASRFEIAQGITAGHVATVVLLPIWWPALRRFWGARPLVVVGLIAVASGLWLASLSSADHAVTPGVLVEDTALLVGLVLGVGVIAWARTLLKDWQVGLWFGLGLVLAISPGTGQYDVNPWKFGFALPVAIVVLALAARRGWRVVEVLALLALAGASAVNDARSGFALLGLAAVITAVQVGRRRPGRRRNPLLTVVVIAALGLAVYNVGLSLVLEGALGEGTQERSLEQIERSGSVFLGGRPELAATLALMAERPVGLGPGVGATLSEILAAKTGMAAINYDPNNGYVERYMFGARTELHSVFGDLWVTFGIPGLALAAMLLLLLLRSLAIGVATKSASALLVYASCVSLWNFFFGPLSTSVPVLLLAIGLGLHRAIERREAAPLAMNAPLQGRDPLREKAPLRVKAPVTVR
jgi:hypothetical protein